MKFFGSIDKRGSRYRARVTQQGQRISRSFDTEEAATQWLNQLAKAARTHRFDAALRGATITVGELLDVFIEQKTEEWKPNTRRTTTSKIRSLQAQPPDLLGIPAASFCTSHIAEMVNRLRKAHPPVAAATIKQNVGFIRTAYNLANARLGFNLDNPVKPGCLPKVNNARDRRLLPNEEEKLLEACAKYETDTRCTTPIGLIVRFALETAMRQAEIAQLRWQDIYKDPQLGVTFVTVDRKFSKNNDARKFPLSYNLAQEITSLRSESTEEGSRVFGSNAPQIRQAFERSAARANLQDLRFHDLRHEATSRLFERHHLEPHEAQLITGHRTIAMLNRYTHLNAQHLLGKMRNVLPPAS